MKVDLVSNLPLQERIPNPALGYIKSYICKFCDKIAFTNHYLNIFPDDLSQSYDLIINYYSSNIKTEHLNYGGPNELIARCLYQKSINFSKNTWEFVFSSTKQFPSKNIEDLSDGIRCYYDKYIEGIVSKVPRVVGFSLTCGQWMFAYYQIALLKRLLPEVVIVIGGIINKRQAIQFMKLFAECDYAVWGEGEVPFLLLLQHMDSPKKINDIPNIAYRNGDRVLTTFDNAPENLPSLDDYPFAEHDDYIKTVQSFNRSINTMVPILGTRSCPWNKCRFCAYSCYRENVNQHYRERSVDSIIEEIEYQTERFSTDQIVFVDCVSGRKNKNDFNHLLTMLLKSVNKRKRPYSIFRLELLVNSLDRTMFDAFKKISAVEPQIGFEATSDVLLKKMEKSQSFAHNIQALKFAEEHKFKYEGLNIIMNIPNETREDVLESLANLNYLRLFISKNTNLRLHPDPLILYKHASFWNDVSDEELSKCTQVPKNWFGSIRDDVSDDELDEIVGYIPSGKHFYLWDQYRLFLEYYSNNEISYKWYSFSDDTSLYQEYLNQEPIEELILDDFETKLLKFCDCVKTRQSVTAEFSNHGQDKLMETLSSLSEQGLLYFNERYCVSIVSLLHMMQADKASVKSNMPSWDGAAS